MQERVGYYKISRENIRRWDRILITHFWKSGTATESETELAQEWALALDKAQQPIWLGERGMQHIRTLRCTRRLSLVISRAQYQESWPGPEQLHKGMLDFALTVELPKF